MNKDKMIISKTCLLVRFFASVAALSVVLAISGCEGGGKGHIWDGHDFGSNNPDLYVAMGDSITAGYGLEGMADSYPSRLAGVLEKGVVNYGVSGSLSLYGAGHVNSVLNAYKPGYLLILYGVNDLIQRRDPHIVLADLRTMIAAAKANLTIPVIATLTPVFNRYGVIKNDVAVLNAGIRLLASEENVHVADLERTFNWRSSYMLGDGLHPNSHGHELIAMTFYEILR